MTIEQAAPPLGLRERKKRRTRAALVRAALELFTRQGYERTTVDEIAEAVDVSQRTFFRYFANKEEVAFAVQSAAEAHFFAALCLRPAHEAPMAALRGAIIDAWSTIDAVIEETIPIELYLRAYRMIESTPVLLAAHLRHTDELEERMAREIARREGLDVDVDIRPRLLVATFSGVMRVTGKLWVGGQDSAPAPDAARTPDAALKSDAAPTSDATAPDPTLESLRDLTVAYLDQLGPALAENWHK
ncbi:TetR family transcriptional regulator [Streptomyces sp. LX-29]|uniref:TetR family transcriptional regulator n=1 Tax=Streptomyces sp. LX-29 TaxID=2900152 RepID=UPI00240D3960|nr:TetR family transcriptional regulator [Streptomyces sp. LX-29]WFB09761.1 TetR family transcriptional regulator [Streptomyces sp. LX-29]